MTSPTVEQYGVVDAVPVLSDNPGTKDALERLLDCGLRGRVVGWGLWRLMNCALREIGLEGAHILSLELPYEWQGYTVRVNAKVRWTIKQGTRSVTVWDMWNWIKRPPNEGETVHQLYRAIQEVGEVFGVRPTGYFGYGQLASPILRREGIDKKIVYHNEAYEELCSRAMFGGRIQSVRIGHFKGRCYEYDLNSAYGWGMSQIGSRLLLGDLLEVEWDIPKSRVPIYPFPVRAKDNSVEYPRQGKGVQWSPLVREAIKHWPKEVKINHGGVAGEREPSAISDFDFINDLYAARRQFEGKPLHDKIAKWTISALWGKLCQGSKRGVFPEFRAIDWAGYTTSVVNAEMLRAAMTAPEKVVAFQVDSILSTGPLGVTTGTGLGEWKVKEYGALQAYQPGIWRGYKGDGTWKERSRGIPEGFLSWDDAATEWQRFGSLGRVGLGWKEFVGLSSISTGEEWLTERNAGGVLLLRPGGLKSLKDLIAAGAGGEKSWHPPDRISETTSYGSQTYRQDSRADKGQEQP